MVMELKVAVDNFDQINTFVIEVRGRLDTNTLKCQLRKGYRKADDGVYWALSISPIVKDFYTEADKAEKARLRNESAVHNGDTVMIEGKLYIAKVLGAYSDACVFKEID